MHALVAIQVFTPPKTGMVVAIPAIPVPWPCLHITFSVCSLYAALYGSSLNPNSAIPKDGRDQCIDNMYIVPSGNPVAALTPATSKVVDDNLEVPKQEDGYDNQYQMLYIYVFVTTLFSHSELSIHNGLVLPGPNDYVSLSQLVV